MQSHRLRAPPRLRRTAPLSSGLLKSSSRRKTGRPPADQSKAPSRRAGLRHLGQAYLTLGIARFNSQKKKQAQQAFSTGARRRGQQETRLGLARIHRGRITLTSTHGNDVLEHWKKGRSEHCPRGDQGHHGSDSEHAYQEGTTRTQLLVLGTALMPVWNGRATAQPETRPLPLTAEQQPSSTDETSPRWPTTLSPKRAEAEDNPTDDSSADDDRPRRPKAKPRERG